MRSLNICVKRFASPLANSEGTWRHWWIFKICVSRCWWAGEAVSVCVGVAAAAAYEVLVVAGVAGTCVFEGGLGAAVACALTAAFFAGHLNATAT